MRSRDTFNTLISSLAVFADVVAVFLGLGLAVWIRLESGWFPVDANQSLSLYYLWIGVSILLFLFIFRMLGLYDRPQLGHFTEKVPRIIRGVFLGLLLSAALAFAMPPSNPPFARGVAAISFFTVGFFLLVQRNILFQLERHWAKHQAGKKKLAIIGTDAIAGKLKHSLEREHRLQSRVVAFIKTDEEPPDASIPKDLIKGKLGDFVKLLDEEEVDEVILANPSRIPHEKMVNIILQCERTLATFKMVPDVFRILTSNVDIQTVDGIPMLGVGRWPLDFFWNRKLKRLEDMVGAVIGLVISAPIIALASILIKATSPGPAFYRQERCGEQGEVFTIYKLRTMKVDAESGDAPGWTTQEDPRKTRLGTFLRAYNLDELPQFWNVLRGEMSLVGPRPERPHFVEQFKEDISKYMWRHAYKPGLTGWAQVNGLRGDTSIQDRIKFDLFYLENWSLPLDFKILLKTFFTRENAY